MERTKTSRQLALFDEVSDCPRTADQTLDFGRSRQGNTDKTKSVSLSCEVSVVSDFLKADTTVGHYGRTLQALQRWTERQRPVRTRLSTLRYVERGRRHDA